MNRAFCAIALAIAPSMMGCRDAKPPAATHATDAGAPRDDEATGVERRTRLLERLRKTSHDRPDDGAALYAIAQLEARLGHVDAALDALAALDAMGWDFPPDDDALPALRGLPRYREMAARMAAREPRVSTSTVGFTIAERGLVPEGIAFDPRSGAFFVSSIAHRKIVTVDARGRARDFVGERQDGLMEALGMKVDVARNLLWVASNDDATGASSVLAFDAITGALRRRATLTGGHELNDLAFDERGNLFVTDTTGGGVYLLVNAVDTLLPYIEPATFLFPNGVAVSDEKPRVFVAHLDGIAIIDRTTKQVRALAHDPRVSLGGIDGLALHDHSLYAAQNSLGRPRIVRFDLDAALERVERATTLETENAAFQVPTTGVIANGAFFYIANSQLDVQGSPEKMREAIVLKTPL